MVQSSLLQSQLEHVGFPTFGSQKDRPAGRAINRQLSPSVSAPSRKGVSTPDIGYPQTHRHTHPQAVGPSRDEHRKGRSSHHPWSLGHSPSSRRQGSPSCYRQQQPQNHHRQHQQQHQQQQQCQPRSPWLRGKARAASPCTCTDLAALTSSLPPDHPRHSSARASFTPITHRPPLFPQTSFDGVNNIKSRSSTSGLISILLSSSLPSDTHAVASYRTDSLSHLQPSSQSPQSFAPAHSWSPSSVQSFSTSGGSSSYLSEVHTLFSDEDEPFGIDADDQNDPNVTVVGSSCSDSSTEGTNIFWSFDSANNTVQSDSSRESNSDQSYSPNPIGDPMSREAFANALSHRLQDARFNPERRRFSLESARLPTIRPRPKHEPIAREPVELGKCPLTDSLSLSTFSSSMAMTTTTTAADLPASRPRTSPSLVRSSEVDAGGPQNLFYLSILKLLSIPLASPSTFSSPSTYSTWAAVQQKVSASASVPEPVPSHSTARPRPVDPEESFHSSLPLLVLSSSSTAQNELVIRPDFPTLKPQALVRFVVQLEMIRQGKIIKGKGHKSWDRILVWKQDRGNKQLGNSKLRWELNREPVK